MAAPAACAIPIYSPVWLARCVWGALRSLRLGVCRICEIIFELGLWLLLEPRPDQELFSKHPSTLVPIILWLLVVPLSLIILLVLRRLLALSRRRSPTGRPCWLSDLSDR
jgi:hypothetical protein